MKLNITIQKRNGFALIYAMIFIALLLITITSIVTMSISELRQVRQSKSSTASYLLARGAIEDGLYQKRNGVMADRRYYFKDNTTENLQTPVDQNKAKNGYYEVRYNGSIIKGTGFGLINGKLLKVDLENATSLHFDGINDGVEFANPTKFDFADPVNPTTFTVEFWFRSTYAGSGRIISKSQSENTGGWGISMTNGIIGAKLKNSTGKDVYVKNSTQVVGVHNDGAWHHVAAIITTSTTDFNCNNGDNVNFFIDGKPSSGNVVCNTGYAYAPDPAHPLVLGYRLQSFLHDISGYGAFWNGDLDEVRISSGARYNSAFTPDRVMSVDAQTVALWHLGEGIGNTVKDETGGGSTGNLINRPSSGSSTPGDGKTIGPVWRTSTQQIGG